MARLEPAQVVSAADYERVRPEYRRLVSRERGLRRLRLGDDCSVQFETPEFALWHVQELLRVEGWSLPRLLRTAADVAPWCPGPGELVATVMIDTADPARARFVAEAMARRGAIMLGVGGDHTPSEVVEAGFLSEPVWYLRWRVGARWHEALAEATPFTCATTWDDAVLTLPAATKAALRADLLEASGSGQPLLHRLIERTQRHVHFQRTRYEARP